MSEKLFNRNEEINGVTYPLDFMSRSTESRVMWALEYLFEANAYAAFKTKVVAELARCSVTTANRNMRLRRYRGEQRIIDLYSGDGNDTAYYWRLVSEIPLPLFYYGINIPTETYSD